MGGLLFNATMPAGVMPMPTTPAEVPQLQEFVHSIVQIKSPLEFVGQLYTVMAVLAMLVCGACAVVLKRLVMGQAYLIQFYPSRYGTFVIPNAILAFCSFLGVYAILLMGYIPLMITRWQRDGGFFLWHTLIWAPLWMGAWFCAWGTVASFPDALRIKRTSSAGELHEYLIRPIFFNIACWGTPLVLLASILPPAILADRLDDSTQHYYNDWSARATALTLPEAGPQEIQMLYSDAMDIWRNMSKAFWYYSICMLVWVFWASMAFVVYAPIGWHTLRRIKEALALCETKMRRQQMETFYLFTSRPPGMTTAQGRAPVFTNTAGKADSDNLTTSPQPIWSTTGFKRPRTPSGTPSARGTEEEWEAHRAEQDEDEDLGRLPCDEEEERSMAIAREEMFIASMHVDDEPSAPHPAVFPPLRPQPQRERRPEAFRPGAGSNDEGEKSKRQKRKAKEAATKPRPMTTAARRYKILRRIYRNMLILTIGVSIAILLFTGITALIAGGQYPASRKNGHEAGRIQIIANLWAAWTNFAFGCLTIGALLWRSFDSALTLRADDVGGNAAAAAGPPRPRTVDTAPPSEAAHRPPKSGRSKILAAANAALTQSKSKATSKAPNSEQDHVAPPEDVAAGLTKQQRDVAFIERLRPRRGSAPAYEGDVGEESHITTFHSVRGEEGGNADGDGEEQRPATPPPAKHASSSRRFNASSGSAGVEEGTSKGGEGVGLGLGMGFPSPLRLIPGQRDRAAAALSSPSAASISGPEDAGAASDPTTPGRSPRHLSVKKQRPTSPKVAAGQPSPRPPPSPASSSVGRRGLSSILSSSPNPAAKKRSSLSTFKRQQASTAADEEHALGSFFEPTSSFKRDDSLDLTQQEQQDVAFQQLQAGAGAGGSEAGAGAERVRGIRRVGPGDMGILDALALVSPPGTDRIEQGTAAGGRTSGSSKEGDTDDVGASSPDSRKLTRMSSTEPSRYGAWRRPGTAGGTAPTTPAH